eukprot:TRINITY_DN15261_c0_g1_i1.p2 TRINITY_DN15261_c0_g1~~TRINITY_DN15261_c0_g1_i1.p2  ORF type:complete len:239 (-),score=32.04 TRINITY_DN15261_c0_g1_i1:93-740(-)
MAARNVQSTVFQQMGPTPAQPVGATMQLPLGAQAAESAMLASPTGTETPYIVECVLLENTMMAVIAQNARLGKHQQLVLRAASLVNLAPPLMLAQGSVIRVSLANTQEKPMMAVIAKNARLGKHQQLVLRAASLVNLAPSLMLAQGSVIRVSLANTQEKPTAVAKTARQGNLQERGSLSVRGAQQEQHQKRVKRFVLCAKGVRIQCLRYSSACLA